MASPRLSLWCFLLLWLAGSYIVAQEAAIGDATSFDEDELVKEIIAAGRGDRDERGVRDQWDSDEHLGKESTFDSRRPMSDEVKRLLKAYRLTCEGCDHNQAVRKVNNYIQEAKRIAKEEQEARERRDAIARTIFGLFVVAVLSAAYIYQKELGLDVLLSNGKTKGSSDEFSGFTEAQKANIMRLRRQHAADAATKRQQATERTKRSLDSQARKAIPKGASGIFGGSQKGTVQAHCRKSPGEVTDRVSDPSPDARTVGKTTTEAKPIAIF